MKALHMVTFILLVVGGLNWGIYGIWGTDLGTWLGGMGTGLSRAIYVIVGVAAVVELLTHKSSCKACDKPGMSSMSSSAPQM